MEALTHDVVVDHLKALEQAAYNEDDAMEQEEARALGRGVRDTDAALRAERDALAAENVRLREALKRLREEILDEDPTPAGWANQIDDALSLQPPTASPSASESVSGDSELERKCTETCPLWLRGEGQEK